MAVQYRQKEAQTPASQANHPLLSPSITHASTHNDKELMVAMVTLQENSIY